MLQLFGCRDEISRIKSQMGHANLLKIIFRIHACISWILCYNETAKSRRQSNMPARGTPERCNSRGFCRIILRSANTARLSLSSLIQPFANVMCKYTCHDGENEIKHGNQNRHLLPLRRSRQQYDYTSWMKTGQG